MKKTLQAFLMKRAFTLVEMITVLAIIAVIFAFSIPFFSAFTKGTRMTTAARDVSTLLRTGRSYAITLRETTRVKIDLDNGKFWIEDKEKEFSLPTTISFTKVEQVGGDNNIWTSGEGTVWFISSGSCVDESGNLVKVLITLKQVGKDEEKTIEILGTTGRVKSVIS